MRLSIAERGRVNWFARRSMLRSGMFAMFAFLFRLELRLSRFALEEERADTYSNAHCDRGLFTKRAQEHFAGIRRGFLYMLCLRAGDLPCFGQLIADGL